MLTTNRARGRLADGGTVYGLICSIPSPTLVEMIGCAGYDFVVIDTEHTLVDPQQLENMIRAAEAVGVTPFVRVGSTGSTAPAAPAAPLMPPRSCGRSTPWRTAARRTGCRSARSPRAPEDHDAWVGRGVRTFVLGEERGLAARALRSHLSTHRGEEN